MLPMHPYNSNFGSPSIINPWESTFSGTSQLYPAWGTTSSGTSQLYPTWGSTSSETSQLYPTWGSTSSGTSQSSPAWGSKFSGTSQSSAGGSTSSIKSQLSSTWGSTFSRPSQLSPTFSGTSDGVSGASSSTTSSSTFGNPMPASSGPTFGGASQFSPTFSGTSDGVSGASSSTTSSSAFGNPVHAFSGPTFGGPYQLSPTFGETSNGVFGASSSTTSSSAFGNQMPAFSGATFGGVSQFSPRTSTGVFGSSSSATSSSAFGNPMPAFGGSSTTSSSAFGSPMPAFSGSSTVGSESSPFGWYSHSFTSPSYSFEPQYYAPYSGASLFGVPSFSYCPSFGPCGFLGAYIHPPTSLSASTQSSMFAIPSTDSFGQTYFYLFIQPQISTSGCQVSKSPHVSGQKVGSSIAPYDKTLIYEGQLCSISAMPVYSDKSHEEIRWEDKGHSTFQSNNYSNLFTWPKPNPFRNTSYQTATSSSSATDNNSSGFVFRPSTSLAVSFPPSGFNWSSFNSTSPAVVSSSPSTSSSNVFNPTSTPSSIFSGFKSTSPAIQTDIFNPTGFASTSPAIVSSSPSTSSSNIFNLKSSSGFNSTSCFAPSTTTTTTPLFPPMQPAQTFQTSALQGCHLSLPPPTHRKTVVDDGEKLLSVSVDSGKSHEELRWELNKGQNSIKALCVSVSNLDINEDEDDEIVTKLMPKLHKSPEYYTEPKIQDLETMERVEPGSITRVSDFVIGRRGYGSIKLLGSTDICQLDLESLVQFNEREVIMYKIGNSKHGVGEELNKEAEVTLFNIKCFDKITGKQCVDGVKVEKYRKMLMKKAADHGIEFLSYDPVEGVWKFKVPTLRLMIS